MIRLPFAALAIVSIVLTTAPVQADNRLTPLESAEHQNEFVPAKNLPWFVTQPPELSRRVGSTTLNSTLSALLKKLAKTAPAVPQSAIKKAFLYYQNYPHIATNRDYVTVLDFDQPSTSKRMHVIDMRSETVVSRYAAHGEKSGTLYATSFSNVEDTHKSSLGIYITGDEYQGKNGRSLYLHGMEATNSNAYTRAIVLHGADYVSDTFVKLNGRLGLSWGCPAIEHQYIDQMVHDLQAGSVLIAHKS